MRGLDHLRGNHPRRVGTSKPHSSPRAPRRCVDGDATRERGRIRAHFRAPLNTRMAANRHQPAHLAPDEPARQRQIDNRAHILLAGCVLGDPHAPDEDGRPGGPDHLAERAHLLFGKPAGGFQLRPGECLDRGLQRIEAGRVFGDEVVIDQILFEDVFQRPAQERDISALCNKEGLIGDLRAEHRAFRDRRHPVAFHPRFAVGIDEYDLSAGLLGVVQVLGRHRLVVGGIDPMKTSRSVPIQSRRNTSLPPRPACP